MLARTSQSHPLEIAAVALPGRSGCIGITLCPGKHHRGLHAGEWRRDLALDLAAIRDWGATVIVNLMEAHEMHALAVADTPERVPEGIEYLRLPIRDGQTPDAGWERAWSTHGPRLHARLAAGERVLVHCKGGLGRSGLVAARLLIEGGVEPRDAIRQVRAARPGAIETGEQVAWVLGAAWRG